MSDTTNFVKTLWTPTSEGSPIHSNNPDDPFKGYPLSFTESWFLDYSTGSYPYFNRLRGRINNILEIGTFEGMSTFWFLLNLCQEEGSHVTTIDHSPSPLFYENLKKLPLYLSNRVSLIKGYSPGVLYPIKSQYNLIFIDGAHNPNMVLHELLWAINYIKPGGIILLDDCSSDIASVTNIDVHQKEYLQKWDKKKLSAASGFPFDPNYISPFLFIKEIARYVFALFQDSFSFFEVEGGRTLFLRKT